MILRPVFGDPKTGFTIINPPQFFFACRTVFFSDENWFYGCKTRLRQTIPLPLLHFKEEFIPPDICTSSGVGQHQRHTLGNKYFQEAGFIETQCYKGSQNLDGI